MRVELTVRDWKFGAAANGDSKLCACGACMTWMTAISLAVMWAVEQTLHRSAGFTWCEWAAESDAADTQIIAVSARKTATIRILRGIRI